MYKQSPIARNKLLEWINDFLCTSYSKLEDTSNGAVACQVLDAIYPQTIPMKDVDFSASTPYECQKNYKILRNGISKKKIPIDFDMISLSKQGAKENYELLSALKSFFDAHYSGEHYDAVGRRRESKGIARVSRTVASHSSLTGIKKLNPGSTVSYDQANHTVLSPSSVAEETEEEKNYSHASQHPSIMAAHPNPVIALVSPSKNRERELTAFYNEIDRLKAENDDLVKENKSMKSDMIKYEEVRKWREQMLESERSFYFRKLRSIEDLLQDLSNVNSIEELRDAIKEILYSREGIESGAFESDDVESVNSNDKVSMGEGNAQVLNYD